MKDNVYTLIVCRGQASFYRRDAQNWENVCLKGEASNSVENEKDIDALLESLNTRINQRSQLANVELGILYGADDIGCLTKISEQLAKYGCTSWQLMHWEKLQKHAALIEYPADLENAHLNETWLVNVLLPLLENALSDAERVRLRKREAEQNAAHAADKAKTEEALRQEILALESHVVVLEQKLQSMNRYDLSDMLVFLPALYRNFWSQMTPNNVALLAGTYDVPQIPSPFPEPDQHTLMQLKQKLQKLPEEHRSKLADFCRQLPHTLDIRPEMRFFFAEA